MAPIERFAVRQAMLPISYSSFADDVSACSQIGFGGLGVSSHKLGQGRDAELVQLLRDNRLKASVCTLAINSVLPQVATPSPTDPTERVESMCSGVQRLAAFSPTGVVALTGGGEGRRPEQARKIVIDGLRQVAKVAQRHAMSIGIEPVRYPEGVSLMSSMSETAKLVADIAADNVGIAYDVWHFWDSPTVLDDIARFGHLINSVHVADWRIPQRGTMDRVLPGEGAIDLASMLSKLEGAGFEGWYELEVFSDATFADSLLSLELNEMLQRAWTGFEAAWTSAGLK